MTLKLRTMVIIPIAWLAFLTRPTEVAGKYTLTDRLAVEDSFDRVAEAETFIDAFGSLFNEVLSNFEHDRAIAVDHIQEATSSLLSHWEQENEHLALLCSTSTEEECAEATSKLQIKRKTGIADAIHKLPQMKAQSMNNYLMKFIELQLEETQHRNELETKIKELEQTITTVQGLAETKIQIAIDKLKSTSSALGEIAGVLENTVTALDGVVYGNICFEFLGASKELEVGREAEYNEAVRNALDFAFMEEKVDVEVVALEVVEEDFTNYEIRKLHDVAPLRNRRRWQPRSRTANVIGVTCRCPTDYAISDVHRRSLQEGVDRELFSDAIMATFAIVLREELPDLYGELESVSTIHCSEFDYLHSINHLAKGGLDHVISAASIGETTTLIEPKPETKPEELVESSATEIIEESTSISSPVTEHTSETTGTPLEPKPEPEPFEPLVGFALRLPQHACDNFQAKYLGNRKQIASSAKCYNAALNDPACTGNEFSFASSRGCMCCLPNPGIGDEAYSSSPFYDVYKYH